MNNPQEMTAAYLEGKLNATQVAELEAYLREDRDRARAFVRQAMLDCQLAELLHEQNVHEVTSDLSDDSQFGSLMKALDAPDDLAPVDFTEVIRRNRIAPATQNKPDAITLQKICNAGEYVLHQALTSKTATRVYSHTAIAAVLLIAFVLFNPFASDGPTPQDIADNTQNKPADSAKPIPRKSHPVATLTATHNAKWQADFDYGMPQSGDSFFPNQRLTLTAGFAQITTNRGAIAILQAPATIELINKNAIRLHTGKLVGICETDSSKGFLVRTPHMDVIDLGTEFAVAVEPDAELGEKQSASEVIVMDGKVRVQPSPEASVAFEPVQLSASESVRRETNGHGLLPTKRAATDFYRSIPDAYEQYVREQDPVGYWPFDQDGALSLITNLGHSGDRLTRIGRVDPDPRGAVGGSARFDGQSRVELSAPRGLDLTHSFTIASWVYLEPASQGIQRVFSNGLFRNGKPAAGFGLGVDHLSTGRAYAFFTFYGIADYRSSAAVLPIGRWVHLAVSVDRAGHPTFYIDGIAVRHQLRSNPSKQTPPPSGRPSDADAWIGDAQVGPGMPCEAFHGRIDELVIIPKPLSSEQIEWLARRPDIEP